MTLFLVVFLGILLASSLGWEGLIAVLIFLGLVWVIGKLVG
jgi:hypothetical protein